MKQESLVEKVIYRLIKKHISGPTIGSAIAKAKQLNSKGIHASITFISQPPRDRAKANYITTTYMELVRQIARMGIRASVHTQLEQLGRNVSKEIAVENLKKILAVSNKYGVFVWYELHDKNDFETSKELNGTRGTGVALRNLDTALAYLKRKKAATELKVTCNPGMQEKKEERKVDGSYLRVIESVASTTKNLVLLSLNEGAVAKLIKNGSRYRKSLVFEYQLGYSERRLNAMLKKGARLSMYVPFGRDWTNYAVNNVPEGYMRALAGNLLKEPQPEQAEESV